METTDDPELPRNGNSPNQTANRGGRPLGAMSRLAKEAREKAIESGELPHEILLGMARGHVQKVAEVIDQSTGEVLKWKYTVPDPDFRRDAAKAAAPYFAPKISTVEVIGGMTDEQLDAIIAGAAAETAASASDDREGTPGTDQAREGNGTRERRSAKPATDIP